MDIQQSAATHSIPVLGYRNIYQCILPYIYVLLHLHMLRKHDWHGYASKVWRDYCLEIEQNIGMDDVAWKIKEVGYVKVYQGNGISNM